MAKMQSTYPNMKYPRIWKERDQPEFIQYYDISSQEGYIITMEKLQILIPCKRREPRATKLWFESDISTSFSREWNPELNQRLLIEVLTKTKRTHKHVDKSQSKAWSRYSLFQKAMRIWQGKFQTSLDNNKQIRQATSSFKS